MKAIILVLGSCFILGHFTASQAELFTPSTSVGGGGTDYWMRSDTLPNGQGDSASFWVTLDLNNPLSPVLRPNAGGTLGIGHIWYDSVEDTIIDSEYVNNATPFYSIFDASNLSGEINAPMGESFIIGFWLDRDIDSTPGEGDVYGWAELMWDGSDLSLLDSAAENSGTGIIAGRYEVVPEPSSVLLLTIGSGGILFYRRARQRQRDGHLTRRSFG